MEQQQNYLVNNYPVAGRCQKPINRPRSSLRPSPRRPRRPTYTRVRTPTRTCVRVLRVLYLAEVIFFLKALFFFSFLSPPKMMYASVSKRDVVSLRNAFSLSHELFFSSARGNNIRPLGGKKKTLVSTDTRTAHTALGRTR